MLKHTGQAIVAPALGLVVDKDVSLRAAVRDALEQVSIETLGASAGAEALERLRDRSVDILVLGDCDPGVSVTEVARQALQLEPAPVVVLIVDVDPDEARSLVELGVFDVAPAPFTPARLELLAKRAQREIQTQRVLRGLARQIQTREGYDQIVGQSAVMERLRQDVERLGDESCAVWVSGEPGCGKKLAARSIHAASSRQDHPFVVVHCAGVDGSDPAAVWSRSFSEEQDAEAGWFERADGGSIFLEGISELPHAAQETLARTLTSDRRPDVRVFASSSGSPSQVVETGHVLEEVREAMAGAELALSPLAQHPEDLALLARHFIATIAEVNHLPPMRLAPDALSTLENYSWPGNVRELRNAIEHAVILAADGVIRADDLPDHVRERQGVEPAADRASLSTRAFREAKREVVGAFEKAYLTDLLRRHRGNVTAASQQSGMLRSALQRLLRKYALKSADFRQPRGEDVHRADAHTGTQSARRADDA